MNHLKRFFKRVTMAIVFIFGVGMCFGGVIFLPDLPHPWNLISLGFVVLTIVVHIGFEKECSKFYNWLEGGE